MIDRLLRHALVALNARCVVLAIALVASTAISAQMLVVLSDESQAYEDVAGELTSRLAPLRDGKLRIDVATASRASVIDDRVYASYELVVTVGLAAAQTVVARENGSTSFPPTLCLLIPRQSFEKVVSTNGGDRGRRISALFIDQPISRQFDLIAVALPGKSRIAVLLGPISAALADDVRDNARERGFAVREANVAEANGVYGALQKILPESDLLLALPDPIALNAATAYNVLLTSYHAQVPVVGFSEGLVKAGALLAVFSTARQQGRQGAEIAARMLMGEGGLPPPRYPRYFTVAVNASVARSFGLRIEDEATLAAAVAERGERARPAREPSSRDGVQAPRRAP